MNDFLDSATAAGDLALEAFKQTIDEATREYAVKVTDNVNAQHVDTGALAASFTVEPVTDRGSKFYGHRAEFKGDNQRGVPFQKIANVLNYGRPAKKTRAGRAYGAIAGSNFIGEAIRRLRGLDYRINQNIENTIKDIT